MIKFQELKNGDYVLVQYDGKISQGEVMGFNRDEKEICINDGVQEFWYKADQLNPLPVPVTLTNNIAERDVTKVINGVTYSNVIHTSSSISSALIPAEFLATSINTYYAPKYGLIESSTIIQLDYLGLTINANLHTKLISADLK